MLMSFFVVVTNVTMAWDSQPSTTCFQLQFRHYAFCIAGDLNCDVGGYLEKVLFFNNLRLDETQFLF